jgi:hypothetical protein
MYAVCCCALVPSAAHLVGHLSTQGALLIKAVQQQTGTGVDAGVFVQLLNQCGNVLNATLSVKPICLLMLILLLLFLLQQQLLLCAAHCK